MQKLIALYKAYSGGEWFGASLRSVRPVADGVVVVFSRRPWLSALSEHMECDCREPLAEFRREFPGYPVIEITGDYTDQAQQYAAGLDAIRSHFGWESRVLIVDTDEVWNPTDLRSVEVAMKSHPDAAYIRAGLYSYIRSPLYQVWPLEPPLTTVALRDAREQPVSSRFRWDTMPGPVHTLSDVRFHHYGWVRADVDNLTCKLLNTSAQEDSPLDPTWIDTVWDTLPLGENLHPAAGYEHVWERIRLLTPNMVPVCQHTAAEDARWRDRVRRMSPEEAIWPEPGPLDHQMYADVAWLHTGTPPLIERLQTTAHEALWLAEFARKVRRGGHVLEIGSGHGGSLTCMALACPDNVRFIAIDPFVPYDEETHSGVYRGAVEGDKDAFYETISTYGYGGRVRHIEKRSTDAAAEVEDGTCDIVMVDGNHSGAIVEQELRMYWPKLRCGGRLIGHDYTTRFPGVIRAVDAWEAESGVPVRLIAGSSLFFAEKTNAL